MTGGNTDLIFLNYNASYAKSSTTVRIAKRACGTKGMFTPGLRSGISNEFRYICGLDSLPLLLLMSLLVSL